MRTVRLADHEVPVAGLFHLVVIYLAWGSTYLAIRVAVRGSDGFDPFTLGWTRLAVAGAILFAWGALRRERIRPTRAELVVVLLTSVLLWLGGNGLVNWAEKRLDSGYAALLIGTTPMWVATIEALVDRRAPSWRFVGSWLLGFAGLVTLAYPVFRAGSPADAWSVAALLGASLSWGTGTVIFQRRKVALSPQVTSGLQQVAGAIGFALIAAWAGERPPPAFEVRGAWLGWTYLTVIGSLVAFTSFLQAIKSLPTRIVTTYAYVNPLVAVILGWLILDEPITRWTVAGSVLILTGVAGIFANR